VATVSLALSLSLKLWVGAKKAVIFEKREERREKNIFEMYSNPVCVYIDYSS